MVLEEKKDILSAIPNLERRINEPLYSPMQLKSYDRERHLEINAVYNLLQEQQDLSSERLSSAIAEEQIRVYSFKGKQYLDRLDVGRIYHQEKEKPSGLTIERYFTDGKVNPFDSVEYSERHLQITTESGELVFEMKDAIFPTSWSE
ncbi:hypothetical protein HYT51_01165, partial [Candidatus Woesearchaeota archaeon]|nr:hypothetical protein [Candidatus Woesearchaeota archaeon]